MRKAKYTLPGGKTIVLRELTVEETIQVMDRWGNKFARAANELAKMALYEYDGKKVSPEDREEIWASLSAKERSLITEAYGNLTSPTDEEREAFFASETIIEE